MTKTIAEVKARIVTCSRCELSSKCRSPIPISTPPTPPSATAETLTAAFAVLGEAPGQLEDYKGTPFIGPAGRLLRQSLRQTGLDPDRGAYFNVVSCWPHGAPSEDEIAACRQNLRDQWDLLGSMHVDHVLITGAVALRAIVPRASLRWSSGLPISVHGLAVFPVLHPAYILRNPSAGSGWDAQLQSFSLLVNGWSEPQDIWSQVTHCLYCSKGRLPETYTCRSHQATWRKDQVWKMMYKQGELGI